MFHLFTLLPNCFHTTATGLDEKLVSGRRRRHFGAFLIACKSSVSSGMTVSVAIVAFRERRQPFLWAIVQSIVRPRTTQTQSSVKSKKKFLLLPFRVFQIALSPPIADKLECGYKLHFSSFKLTALLSQLIQSAQLRFLFTAIKLLSTSQSYHQVEYCWRYLIAQLFRNHVIRYKLINFTKCSRDLKDEQEEFSGLLGFPLRVTVTTDFRLRLSRGKLTRF